MTYAHDATAVWDACAWVRLGRWRLTFTNHDIAVEEIGVTGSYTYCGAKREHDRR